MIGNSYPIRLFDSKKTFEIADENRILLTFRVSVMNGDEIIKMI
jgi:hypothetical protein